MFGVGMMATVAFWMIMKQSFVHLIGVMIARIPAANEPPVGVPWQDFLADYCMAFEWHYDIAWFTVDRWLLIR
jgi:hypothetical protein